MDDKHFLPTGHPGKLSENREVILFFKFETLIYNHSVIVNFMYQLLGHNAQMFGQTLF